MAHSEKETNATLDLYFVAYSLIQWLQHRKLLKEIEKKLRTFSKTLIVFRIYLQKKKYEWISENLDA